METEEITIEDFEKIKLRLGKIISCEKHPNADRLLLFKVDLGDEVRTIISGIAKYYDPQELIGVKVVVCVNLKPVKLRGIESNGMILSALDEENLSLITIKDDVVNPGAEVR